MATLTCIKIKDENGQEMDIWMEAVEQLESTSSAIENRRDGVTRGGRDSTTRGDSAQ
jgi:hypothetical protein